MNGDRYWYLYVNREDLPCNCCDAYPCTVHRREPLPVARVLCKWWDIRRFFNCSPKIIGIVDMSVMQRAYEKEMEILKKHDGHSKE